MRRSAANVTYRPVAVLGFGDLDAQERSLNAAVRSARSSVDKEWGIFGSEAFQDSG